MKEEVKKILVEALERADLAKIADDILDRAVEPALQKLVDDTTNPFDNMLKSAIGDKVQEEIKKMARKEIEELIADLKK